MHIKEPLKIKELELKNRIVMPPMASDCSNDGSIGSEHLRYYSSRCASGHIGLVITEHMYVCRRGMASRGQLGLDDDSCIPGLRMLTDTIHAAGAKCIAQLNHAGFRAPENVIGITPIGPSAMLNTLRNGTKVWTQEFDKRGLKKLVEDFTSAALRAKSAGYDGVEIHSAHGYLLTQFYSPITNHRQDEYGGSIENRIRLHLEIVAALREALGEEYPIAIRLGGSDYMPGGSSIEDCVKACIMFERAGVDLIDLSGGLCGFAPMGRCSGILFDDMSRAVKAAVKLPVLLTGGITTGTQAENLLAEKACDLVGIGRALLKDPSWPEKNVYNI